MIRHAILIPLQREGLFLDYSRFTYNTDHAAFIHPVFQPAESIDHPFQHHASYADSIIRRTEGFGYENMTSWAHFNEFQKADTLWLDDGNYEELFSNHFDGQGRITSSINWYTFGDTASLRMFGYNASTTQVTTDTTYYHSNNVQEDQFDIWNDTYNTSGKLTEALYRALSPNNILDTLERHTFAYNPSGQLITALKGDTYSGQLRKVVRDSFGYQPGVDFFVAECSYDYDQTDTNYFFAQRLVKTIGTNGLPDTMTASFRSSNFEPFEDASILLYTYNDFNNPEFIGVLPIEDGILGNEYMSVAEFYYEEYTDNEPSKISSIKKGGSLFRISQSFPKQNYD